tara:strand:- start:1159 stop:4491 length:3333 start_codon:yes stop_codon:yes gene_type:complete
MAYMVNRDAPYSGLATLMNMSDKNPNTQLAYIPSRDLDTRYKTIFNPSTGIPQAVGLSALHEGGSIGETNLSPTEDKIIDDISNKVSSQVSSNFMSDYTGARTLGDTRSPDDLSSRYHNVIDPEYRKHLESQGFSVTDSMAMDAGVMVTNKEGQRINFKTGEVLPDMGGIFGQFGNRGGGKGRPFNAKVMDRLEPSQRQAQQGTQMLRPFSTEQEIWRRDAQAYPVGGMRSLSNIPMRFAGGGSISDKANEVASHGRYGDTTLVHMTPNEVGGLASLGELTINPDTGLPEAFNLGSVFPLIANIGLAAVTGGMSVPMQMAVMGGANLAMGLAQGEEFGDALFGAALSAAGTGLMRGITGAAGAGSAGATGQSFTDTALALPTDAQIMAGITPPGFEGVSGGASVTGGNLLELGTEGFQSPTVTPPTPSAGSKIFDWIKENPFTAAAGGAGLAGLALSGGGDDVDIIEEEETERLPQFTFSGHKPREPLTEEGYLDLALRGKDALDDDDIDEDGQLAYDFFTPGEGTDGSFYTRKNKGGLVGLPQTGQRSNVTNFMLAGNKGMPTPFNIFELGKGLGDMGKEQPNTGVMQLSYGGQPKSNVAQMLNPTSKQNNINMDGDPDSHKDPLPVVDNLSGLAGILGAGAKVAMGTNPITALLGTFATQALFNQEEPEPSPVDSFGGVSSGIDPLGEFTGIGGTTGADDTTDAPDTTGMSDEEDNPDDEGTASLTKGGIVGLAKGGRLDPLSKELLRKRMLQRESSGNYSSVNPDKYVGGYQFGAEALEDLGYIKKGKSKLGNKAMWNPKNWTGKNGITDLDSFFKDTSLQDRLFNDYAERNFKTLKGKDIFKKDSSPEHVAGMLAASHLLGATQASKNLSATDKNKISGHEYYKLGKKSIEPALNLGSTKGEHRRIASQKREEQKSMPVSPVPSKTDTSKNQGMLEGLETLLMGGGNTKTTLERGDTLTGKANQSNISLKELLEANPNIQNPDKVLEGQEINIPNNSNILQRLKSIIPFSEGGTIDQYFEGQVIGKGDGQSDQILFEVEGKNPDMALLSRDEYVLPADAVSMLGNGSSNAGAKELDNFVKSLRQQSFGTQQQQRQINPQRGLSALV